MKRIRPLRPMLSVRALPESLRQRLPKSAVHWLSVVAVWAVLLVFFAIWFRDNWGMLTNPDLTTDDARTATFAYHRWEPDGALKHDPIAKEMLSYQPPFVRGLYFVFVKATDVFRAIKLVQLVCILIIFAAAAILLQTKRLGLLAASVLLFICLRDAWMMNRISGGLPRAFAFPCFALWLSGALTLQGNVRRVAIALAALTYPSALAMLLASEGVLAMANRFREGHGKVLAAMKHYAVTVLLALVAVAPSVMSGNAEDGQIHSLLEAKQEPAFGKSGRLGILPFEEPRHVFGWEFAATYMPQGQRALGGEFKTFDEHLPRFAFVLISALMVIVVVGLAPAPMAAIAFFCGCALMYFASCFWAFKLYSPERFYSFGMRMAGAMLLINVLATFGEHYVERVRYPLRNFVGAFSMLAILLFLGTGYADITRGSNLNRATLRPLNDYVATLPLGVRIAGHPLDSDDIPFWAARATMGGYETLQPWLKGSWARQKARTEATLTALYATESSAVLAYAHKHKVTHFLINRNRYTASFVNAARMFEPLNTFFRRTFSRIPHQSLVFQHPPPAAIIYSYSRFQLISVERLEKLWSKPPPGS